MAGFHYGPAFMVMGPLWGTPEISALGSGLEPEANEEGRQV